MYTRHVLFLGLHVAVPAVHGYLMPAARQCFALLGLFAVGVLAVSLAIVVIVLAIAAFLQQAPPRSFSTQ
jgi:hypothetical protein